MKRYLWLLRHRTAEWGPQVALALLVLATLFWLAFLRPLDQRLAEQEAAQLSERDGQLRGIDVDAGRNAPTAERLAKFYKFFAAADGITDQLARLHGVAQANGLVLRRAEYRMQANTDQKLARYQIIMPVQGAYPAIRRFAAQALAEIPTLALTQVQFQRKAIGEAAAEAQITFTLYLAR